MTRTHAIGLACLLVLTPLGASAAPPGAVAAAGAELSALALLLLGLIGLGIVGTPRPVREDRPDAPPTVREAPAAERRIA